MKKRVLFVNRKPPHGTHHARESQQMAMVLGAFEQTVNLLFMGDGVYTLLSGQKPDIIGFDHYIKAYASLEKYYDIAHIYVDHTALNERGITTAKLQPNVSVLQAQEIQTLFRCQDFIIEI